MFHEHRSRDYLEATQELIAHLLQHLAKKSAMSVSALAWMEPGETTTASDRQLYQLEFSLPEGRERHNISVPAGLLAAGATDKRSHLAWTAALATFVASPGMTP